MNRLTAIGLASLVAYGLLLTTKYMGVVSAAHDEGVDQHAERERHEIEGGKARILAQDRGARDEARGERHGEPGDEAAEEGAHRGRELIGERRPVRGRREPDRPHSRGAQRRGIPYSTQDPTNRAQSFRIRVVLQGQDLVEYEIGRQEEATLSQPAVAEDQDEEKEADDEPEPD